MSKGIRLSEKHGVNPSIVTCFYCGDTSNELVLFGRLPGDVEAPRKAVLNREPCAKCADLMQQGVLLICVDADKTSDEQDPWRTGQQAVITEEAVLRIFDPKTSKMLLNQRLGYLPIDVWKVLGLPEGDVDESQN